MFVATLTTEHYEFTALGETREEVDNAIHVGLVEHGSRLDGPDWSGKDWWLPYEDAIIIQEIDPGQCLRDGFLMSDTRRMAP